LNHLISLNGPTLDIESILYSSNAGILTSTNEGTPISLLEYINYGLPVIVTDVGDCKDIVLKSNCGYVIEVNNISQFSSQLFQLITNYDTFKINSPYARKVIENTYGIDTVASKYITDIYV
jgi:glycosyltransferase involved in cell wall biosynthesis